MKKLTALVLSVVAALCFLLKQVFDYVIAQEPYSLIVFPYTLFSVIVVPIIYMGGMVALLLFLVPMKNSHSHLLNKKFLLIFSFGFVFLYVVAAVVFGLTFHNIGYPVWCWNVLQWLCKNPIIFSIVGFLIFMGINSPDEQKQ